MQNVDNTELFSEMKKFFEVSSLEDVAVKLGYKRTTAGTWRSKGITKNAIMRYKNLVLESKKYLTTSGKPQIPDNIQEAMEKVWSAMDIKHSTPLHVEDYQIPLLSARVSAGGGEDNYEVEVVGNLPISPKYFKLKPNLKKLKALHVIGDSMIPTLNNDDIIVIEEGIEFNSDGVYVIRICNELRVKRLIRRMGGIEIKSDNPTYGLEFVKNDDIKGFSIIGKVILEIKRY